MLRSLCGGDKGLAFWYGIHKNDDVDRISSTSSSRSCQKISGGAVERHGGRNWRH